MTNTKGRNSNIEILRIISMFLIVLHHYAVHGLGTTELKLAYLLNRYVATILSLGGKLGVTIFVLISGYYMCKSKITLKKLLILALEVFFYSSLIYIAFRISFGGAISRSIT